MCSVCDHPKRTAIDAALLGGTPYRKVADQYDLGEPATYRHRASCLALKQPAKRAEAAPKQPEADAPSAAGRSLPHQPALAAMALPSRLDDPSTSPRAVVTLLIEDRALDLRCKGKSYAAIAAELGISEDTALDAVTRVCVRTRKGTNAKADAARRLDVERIDRLIAGVWDRATTPPDTYSADDDGPTVVPDYEAQDRAIAQVTKLLERRAKLLGLDAPTGVRLSIVDAAKESQDFGEVYRVIFKILDARHPGASALVAAGLEVYQDQGEAGVDRFLAGDLATVVQASE